MTLYQAILYNINGLVQDCSNSIANTLELLQFCTKPLFMVPIFCDIMQSRAVH